MDQLAQNPRQQALLCSIIKEYIATAEPVGSKLIVDKYNLRASSATVRNEMAELEAAGYISQPYTSAGRVPTEKAYRYYLANWFKAKELGRKEQQELAKLKQASRDRREQIKILAKGLAELSKLTVFVSFTPNDFYYTGISHLFRQPEFCELEDVREISEVVDQMDELMEQVYHKAQPEIKFFMGEDNPFSPECASLVTQLSRKEMFGILGPLRIDYEHNWARINYLKKLMQ